MSDRVLILVLVLALLPASVAWAQTGTVQGTVVDQSTGETLPGANVVLEDTERGAVTDAEGEFQLANVPAGSYTVIATFLGYTPAREEIDLAAGETVTLTLELIAGEVALEGLAVTALGFTTQRDRQATASSNVSGADIVQSGEVDVLRGLSAKASGVQITGMSGDPGAGARIQIRGQTTIQGDNQPLIVIDGVPMSNETQGSGVDGVIQQSRLNDLNPEDIESIEVLKGASAAALWGSRAQGGVVVIQTRSGAGLARTNVSFRSSINADFINQTVPLQQEYGQGWNGWFIQNDFMTWGDRIPDRPGGEDEYVTDPNDPAFRGAAQGLQTGEWYYGIPGGTPDNPHGGKRSQQVHDHAEDFFNTGYTLDNSLSISGAMGDEGSYYLSLGNTTQEGIIPGNSDYQRTSVRLNADHRISEDLSVGGIANFVRTSSDRVQQGSNISGLMLGLLRTPPDYDLADYQVDYFPLGPEGAAIENRHRSYRNQLGAGINPGYDNPLFTTHMNLDNSLVNRFIGRVNASYDPLDWLNLTSRVGIDTYGDRRQGFFPVFNASAPAGQLFEQEYSGYELTADLIGRSSHILTDDIQLRALLGGQISHRENDFLGTSLENFSNPEGFRSLENAELADVSAGTSQTVRRTIGMFSELNFDLYDQLFLTFTGRVDNASTFGPEAQSTFFYPSAQGAWQFHHVMPQADWLSFGRLRATFAQVGREPDPYLAFTYFTPGSYFDGYQGTTLQTAAYGGGFTRSARQASPAIIPERTTEFEIGVDFRLFDDRFTFGSTYYNNASHDLIFNVDVAPSTGFLTQTQNAAQIDNWGVELEADFNWIDTGDFGWTTFGNWSTNRNTVVDLVGVEEVSLAGFVSLTSSLVEGEPFGSFWGGRWRDAERTPLTGDEQEAGFTVADDGRVLNALGFPTISPTEGVVGDPNPEWMLGIGNTFRYQGLSVDVLFDIRHGGDVWNGTRGALYYFGTHGEQNWTTTVSAEEAGTLFNFFGETVEELAAYRGDVWQNDDGSYGFRGYVEDFGAGPRMVDQTYFWSGPGSSFTGTEAPFIEDGGFVRLREVTLGYNWAGGLVQQAGLSSVDFSLTGRNLLLFTDYTGIDPETNLTGPGNGQGLDYFNNPSTRSFRFSMRFNY